MGNMKTIKWWLWSSHFNHNLQSISLKMLILAAFLTLGLVVASHGAQLSPQLYWKSVLPNTLMPKAIRDIAQMESISITQVKSGKWVGKPDAAARSKYGKRYDQDPPVSSNPNPNPDHLSIYFFENDIQTGTLMNLDFTANPNPNNGPSFLSRKASASIPFSTSQFPQILTRFDMNPESRAAKTMNETIAGCEEPAMKGEETYCATSLESIVDFITSKIGSNVVGVSTETGGRVGEAQRYTIAKGSVDMSSKASDKVVVCHKQNYPYVVYYCHRLVKTRAYVVPMVGSDGTKVDAVGVCHLDTSEWSPKHLAFRMLKAKPGTSTICHFLPPQQFVCLPKN